MNLTFTELDENESKNVNKRKPRISYDDILSSMGTVVINGKLEFVRKNNNLQQNYHVPSENMNNQTYKKVVVSDLPQPINKNSYIYNKYFKNYKEPIFNEYVEEPVKPMTKEEFVRQLIINRANEINQRNRIAEIKSTKLLFNNNNNKNIVINTMQNQNGLNRLFNLKS
jgi:predicted SAM-dependent methyltransferase